MKKSFSINLYQHPFLDHGDTFLRAIGAAFFCTHPLSGAFFLLALAIISPLLAILGALGALSAQLTATLLKCDRAYMKVGFHIFNGALVGMYWTVLKPLTPLSLACLVACAALTAPLMMLFNRIFCLSRFNLPPLSLASLTVVYPAMLLLRAWRISFPPTMIKPVGFDALFQGKYLLTGADWMNRLAQMDFRLLAGMFFFFLGIAIHSRRTLRSTLKGMIFGIAVAFIFGGYNGLEWRSLYMVTTTPIAMALDGFFLVPSMAAGIFTFLGLCLGAGLWFFAVPIFNTWGIPELTVPFFLATLIMLFLAHLKPVQSIFKSLKPVPLVYVLSPETAIQWHRDLETAHRFWNIITPKTSKKNWEGTMDSRINQAVDLILNSNAIVAFTGAGVSTESGIPDFRTGEVHWKQYDSSHFRYENFAASEVSRAKYWEMSQDFYLLIKQARPNRAHLALTELERMGKLLGIITQNVDRLHHKAGVSAQKIIELHGNELFVTCLNCGKKYTRAEIYEWILNGVRVPYCLSCQGILKPDSIAFGQPMPMEISRRALAMVLRSDLMIIMGTSLLVQPAALLPWKAKENGARLIIINLSSTVYDEHADVLIRDYAGKAMEKIMERIEGVRGYIQL